MCTRRVVDRSSWAVPLYLCPQAVLPERSWELVASPFTGYGPTRTEHLAPANLDRWLAYGYHPDDIAGFIAVTREALSSPNIATGGWGTESLLDLIPMAAALLQICSG